VTIVEFSDMQCPHCQKAAAGIDQLLAQEPEAHFIFQNFPLPSHNWAEKAAGYVDCVGRASAGGASNDAVWKFIQKTFDEQANITEANADEKLRAIATGSGANGEEIAACAVKPDTKADRGLPCARKIGGREWHADSVHQWTERTRRGARRADEEDCGLPGKPEVDLVSG